jgi:hypothetical protein
MGRSLNEGGLSEGDIVVRVHEESRCMHISNNAKMFNAGPVEVDEDQLDELLDGLERAFGQKIHIDEPAYTVTRVISWLKRLAAEAEPGSEAQAQLESLADDVIGETYVFRRSAKDPQFGSAADSEEICVGPVSLDVEMAKAHGWTRWQI